jgi:hypothetical protein
MSQDPASDPRWDALSNQRWLRLSMHCIRQTPVCRHQVDIDIDAMIAAHGDITLRDLRRRARCTVCGHRGAGTIGTPIKMR